MYIDYEYYAINVYEYSRYQMDRATFSGLEFRVEKTIDRYTFNRVKTMKIVPEAVKRLMLELIEIERVQSSVMSVTQEQPIVKSFSNDGYSETYEIPTAEQVKQIEQDLIFEYLSGEVDDNGVPLLYLGVGK